MEALELYTWIAPVTAALSVPLLFLACLRRLRIAPALAALVCLETAMLYLPVAVFSAHRIDRLRGAVQEPLPEARQLVAAVVVTLALAAVHVFMTRARFALAVAAILNGVLLLFVWLFLVLPYAGGWWPVDRRRADLLVPFRPCRGARVWRVERGRVRNYGRIDDVWQRFDDPRSPGRPVRGVSVAGEWREEYLWLDATDMVTLHVRIDDPAVVRCDGAARPERVAPEPWHQVGLSW